MLRNSVYVAIASLVILLLITTSCASKLPVKPLSDNEKAELIQASLSNSRANVEYKRSEGIYQTEFMWTEIPPHFYNYQGGIRTRKRISTDKELLEIKDGTEILKSLAIYPTVLLKFGESEDTQVRVALDRETKTTLFDEIFVREGSNAHIPIKLGALVAVHWIGSMSGTQTYMFIYKGGSATYIEETGWRIPSSDRLPLSIIKTGQVSAEKLNSLSTLFHDVVYEAKGWPTDLDRIFRTISGPGFGLYEHEAQYKYHDAVSDMISADMFCLIEYHENDENKRIVANYDPFFNDYMSLTDISNDVKNIYSRLKYIADYKTRTTKYRYVIS